jgi:ubiquitin C-terminal hydrolase
MSKNGILNLGATCYLNTAVQCLSHCPKFVESLLEYDATQVPNSKKIFHSLSLLLKQLRQTTVSFVNPSAFIVNTQERFPKFEQNDMAEFLEFILSSIHDETKGKVTMKVTGKVSTDYDKITREALENFKMNFESQYSIIIQLFYGQTFINMLSMDAKPSVSRHLFDYYCVLALPLMNDRDSDSLEQCLKRISQSEVIEEFQINDDIRQMAQQTFIWSTSLIHIFQLKRFINGKKNCVKVTFPLTLQNVAKGSVSSKLYTLVAIGNHIGSVESGHFFADCKGSDGVWRRFDDTSVSVISDRDFDFSAAYCLFYTAVSDN